MKQYILLPDEIMNYLQDDFEGLDLVSYNGGSNPKDKPLPVLLPVPHCMLGTGCRLELNRRGFPDSKFSLDIAPGQQNALLRNLYSGVVYDYVFKADDIKHNCSGCFETAPKAPRLIDVDGICNVRDAGGWQAGNAVIRQGLLYRGSEMNLIGNHAIEITPAGINTMLEELKIKTDLDLRNDEEAGFISSSPLGERVKYIHLPVLGYMDIFQEQFNQRLHEIFRLFANPDSYPIYIHCWAGADRTGTVIALLKSALGVSYHDITRDFEISTFAKFGVRGRCNKDFTYVEVFEHLKNNYPGTTLKEQARAFLTQTVGLTQQNIADIEKILLEPLNGSGTADNNKDN